MKVSRLLALMIVPIAMFGQRVSQAGSEARMESLTSMLKSGAVTKVQVLHMPDSVMTRVAVTLQVLRSIANSKVEFKDRLEETFDPLFSGLLFKKEDHAPDLRWGMLFYDANNHEVGSLFVDKFGHYGYLNDGSGSFKTALLDANLARRLHKIVDNKR